jgi:hypothetical protein
MKAIEVHYRPCGIKTPARWVAKAGGNPLRTVVSADSNTAADAALKLARRMNWKGTLVAGGLNHSEVFCFLESDKYEI